MAGVPDSVTDHIDGHAAANVGQSYGGSELRRKLEALSRIHLPMPPQAEE